MEVILTYPTPQGSRQFVMSGESLTIGRGAVDLRVDDESMSRHHATIYREGDKVWILDENSTNGTFVNGVQVSSSGTPLRNGDAIRIGNETVFNLGLPKETAQKAVAASVPAARKSSAGQSVAPENFSKTPLIITGVSVLIIALVGVGIGATWLLQPPPLSKDANEDITQTKDNGTKKPVNEKVPDEEATPIIKRRNDPKNANSVSTTPLNSGGNSPDTANVSAPGTPISTTLPSGKTYLQMSPDEQSKFVETEAEKIARVIGNREGESITPDAVKEIKHWVDGYARRLNSAKKSDCSAKGWLSNDLTTVLDRASKNAPFINTAFSQKSVPSQIGLYLAMIESEHCVCLQSGTGPLGMFQFTYDTATRFYDDKSKIVKGSTPGNPDQRCEPEPSAKASANYMTFLRARYGTGPNSFPLAIASYNSGEGALSQNLEEALKAAASKERSFWTMILKANELSNKYSTQFRKENKNYVPKFFGAAIIGENPSAFGVNMPALSSFTK